MLLKTRDGYVIRNMLYEERHSAMYAGVLPKRWQEVKLRKNGRKKERDEHVVQKSLFFYPRIRIQFPTDCTTCAYWLICTKKKYPHVMSTESQV